MECSPLVPGHEIIGNVAAVPEGETTWKVGDRIGGAWHGGHDGAFLHGEAIFVHEETSLMDRFR